MKSQEKRKDTSLIDKLLMGLKEIFAPNLVALTGAGILKGIIILLLTFNIIQPETAEQFILYHIADAVFYFLPVLLAYSSAKVFGTNPALAASVALFLVHPEFTEAVQTRTGDFFGIPVAHNTYISSVIPIILIIWAQSYIEKAVNKVLPKMIKGVFSPVLILMLTGVLGVLVIGPVGTFFGNALGVSITWLNEFAGWLVSAILGGFGMFIIMAGGHYALIPISAQNLAQVGFDNLMMTGLLPGNMAMAGAAFAIAMRTKSNSYKQYSVSAAVTALLGVSQPALYGVAIPIKKAMISIIAGGFIGGLYAGIVGVKGFALSDPGLAALPAYISPDGSWGNFINTLITIAISFGVTFVLTYLGAYKDLSPEEIDEITANK
ncbi:MULTISPECIES: PTS transporter subunit EIIC [unclassified Jeotgalibaca]|uniref:PTS transporter subunit EIIC n=1 Tax=unclassified Jeotgalibaca TaxID=2621505 RepID=UPI003FD65BD6